MTDPLIRDSLLSIRLLILASLILLPAALFGLEAWPGQEVVAAALSLSPRRIGALLGSMGYVLAAVYWASHPTRPSRWWVTSGSIGLALLFWYAMGGEIGLDRSNGLPVDLFAAAAFALPCLLALVWRSLRSPQDTDPVYERRLRWLVLATVMFLLQPAAGLQLTVSLHPQTYDLFALRFDQLAGLDWSSWIITQVDQIPGLRWLLHTTYGLTPLGFLAVALLQLRGRPPHVATALLAWVVMTSLAVLAYHAFPVAGPVYVFGSDDLAEKMRHAELLPVAMTAIPLAPRNGMPSMHFGWMLAASILWWQNGTRPWSRALLVMATVCTALATLYTGEHYVIDLVVAIPFVLSSLALCSTGVGWNSRHKQEAVIWGGVIWLSWMTLLRNEIDTFVANPWAAKLLVLLTLGIALRQAWLLRRFESFESGEVTVRADRPNYAVSLLSRKFAMMFFVSGAAALVYQVLFAKELALVFGSTATATLTVLATFLGGMAIGSLIGGLIAQRFARPLLAYAVIEAAIGLYCIITPSLFSAIQNLYVAFASGLAPDEPLLMMMRVVFGASVLLVPTVLMGTTLPLLAIALGKEAGRMGARVAWLYLTNTAGAATGALFSAYFIIPALGVKSTTLVAALMNLTVAFAAISIAKAGALTRGGGVPERKPDQSAPLDPGLMRGIAFLALGVGGILSLGLEVVYVHMLSIVAGNSVYAFGLMVATFLIGLSFGGEVGRRILMMRRHNPGEALAIALLGLSASVSAGVMFWDGIPEYFAGFADHAATLSFGARESIRAIVCALTMMPPAIFIGAAYAFAMDILTSAGRQSPAISLGIGGMVNTLGNIFGVLLFGFLLLPWLGGVGASRLIGNAALALALLVMFGLGRRYRMGAVVLSAGAVLLSVQAAKTELDYDQLSSGANVYFYPQHWGTIIDHAESIDGGLTSVASRYMDQHAVRTLLTNGKFQGNDSLRGEMQAQVGFALAPLLHTDKRDRALVIGYGTGVSSRVLHEAGFKNLEIAELSKDVMSLADRYFGAINRRVSQAPNVTLHVTDGRNLLLLSKQRFDLISIEISSIWFAGAASLYNREFYQLARQRMSDDGVLQQWMQLHRLNPTDVMSIIATARSEFRFVSLYVIGQQGILVATNSRLHKAPNDLALQALNKQNALGEVRQIVGRDLAAIATEILLSPEGVDRLVASVGSEVAWLISTDNNLRLEYSTPKANVNDPVKSYEANIRLLRSFASPG